MCAHTETKKNRGRRADRQAEVHKEELTASVDKAVMSILTRLHSELVWALIVNNVYTYKQYQFYIQ